MRWVDSFLPYGLWPTARRVDPFLPEQPSLQDSRCHAACMRCDPLRPGNKRRNMVLYLDK
jgi:hypothetical protein